MNDKDWNHDHCDISNNTIPNRSIINIAATYRNNEISEKVSNGDNEDNNISQDIVFIHNENETKNIW